MKYLIYLILYCWSISAYAHKPSDSYLAINVHDTTISGRWDIALRDLDFAIDLDSNNDAVITWGELKEKIPEIRQTAFANLIIQAADTTCALQNQNAKVDSHTDGNYIVLLFTGLCADAVFDKLKIKYTLFADIDPQHRGLLKLNVGAKQQLSAVLVPKQAAREFNIAAANSQHANVLDFIHEGFWHILIGFDHILFLFSLLLPSVLVWRNNTWLPVSQFKTAFCDVVKVVTAFTLAHSITLSMASLGYVELPSRWVESVIAASVILAALNNIYPVFSQQRAKLAFGFGLIHGFGFASVLTDLNLSEAAKLWSLFGFNVGVEIGQLSLVLMFLPISYLLSRNTKLYQPVMLRSCSLVIAGIAGIWLLERAFAINIMQLPLD